MKVGLPFSLLSIWLSFGSADAMSLKEPQICYILDAVLFIYGIVLTVLYCRMKVLLANEGVKSGPQFIPGKRLGSSCRRGVLLACRENKPCQRIRCVCV
uniref:Fc fragment of IgE, high affinity I, receptor for; gamma polypeptide n=1 Tax=Sinocyclocheilus anshuiensis TaxID=1608454 RepID=A0A671Q5T4_9TELE